MNGESNYAQDELDKYLVQIDEFIECNHFTDSTYKEQYKSYADLTEEDLRQMGSKELLDGAYFLFGYCSYIQDCANKQRVILNWCNSQLEKIVSKYEKESGFDKYTKHESKKPIVIRENIYAEKVEELRLIAESKYQILELKSLNIKKRGEVLMEKSRK